MRVTLIGAGGFVGSAFARHLPCRGVDLVPVTRQGYAAAAGAHSDVVIEAACNSRKYLSDERPLEDFERSVTHRLRTLLDFPARLHVHISSVDVYPRLESPLTTREDAPELGSASRYGFHKLLAEQLVRHYAPRWLIVRLAGMVGPGLKKNPVYDVLTGQPLRLHPDSRYQFMATDDVARIVWDLVERGVEHEIFNVCGAGLVSPREVADLAGKPLDLTRVEPGARPRIVDASIEKISAILPVPGSREAVAAFVGSAAPPR